MVMTRTVDLEFIPERNNVSLDFRQEHNSTKAALFCLLSNIQYDNCHTVLQ